MTLPEPHPGLVISYSYLWADEHKLAREEGVKNRPCAIVMARQFVGGETATTVVPITHSQPREPEWALELPTAIKNHLGLDDERSWVVVNEINEFVWPGPDLEAIRPGNFSYGVLPPTFFRKLRDLLLRAHTHRHLARIHRTE